MQPTAKRPAQNEGDDDRRRRTRRRKVRHDWNGLTGHSGLITIQFGVEHFLDVEADVSDEDDGEPSSEEEEAGASEVLCQ